MRLEIERNAVHLLLGLVLACLVLIFKETVSLVLFGTAIVIGVFLSEVMRRGMRVPGFWHAIARLERRGVKPGTGMIHFFFGAFLALAVAEYKTAAAALIIFAFVDSFSTVVGKAVGKIRVWKKKTLEGIIAGFVPAFFASLFFLTPQHAFIVVFVASLAELFSPVDDNIVIPPAAAIAAQLARFYI